MIAIVDYGVGNLFSLLSSLRALDLEAEVTGDAGRLRAADRIILPGVGAFGDARAKLDATGLVPVIQEEAEKKPLLGICLGMQLLFDKSFEYGEHPGLGLVPGQVVDLRRDLTDKTLKVPHMGWNSLQILKDDPLFRHVRDGEYVYYVHSFYARDCAPALWPRPGTAMWMSPVWCAGETSTAPSSTRRNPGTRDCGCCGPLQNCEGGCHETYETTGQGRHGSGEGPGGYRRM